MFLYKYRSFEQLNFALDILFQERLYCARYKDLNDPFEGVFYSILSESLPESAQESGGRFRERMSGEELSKLAENTRICSLSATSSDVRMWSLYASGHTGMAIEIDISGEETWFNEVMYEPNIPEFHENDLSGLSEKEIFSRKTDHWAFEKEYRVICDKEWCKTPGRIKSVIVGPRVSANNRELLGKILDDRIPILDTRLSSRASVQVIGR